MAYLWPSNGLKTKTKIKINGLLMAFQWPENKNKNKNQIINQNEHPHRWTRTQEPYDTHIGGRGRRTIRHPYRWTRTKNHTTPISVDEDEEPYDTHIGGRGQRTIRHPYRWTRPRESYDIPVVAVSVVVPLSHSRCTKDERTELSPPIEYIYSFHSVLSAGGGYPPHPPPTPSFRSN